MTSRQAEILLTLADMYIRLGRLDRGILLADLVLRYAADDLNARRILAWGYLLKGWSAEVLAQIDTLVEHEFDSVELAFALQMQSRALHLKGNPKEARQVWGQFVGHCQAEGLSPETFIE